MKSIVEKQTDHCPHCRTKVVYKVMVGLSVIICPACLNTLVSKSGRLTLLSEEQQEKMNRVEPTLKDRVRMQRVVLLKKRYENTCAPDYD